MSDIDDASEWTKSAGTNYVKHIRSNPRPDPSYASPDELADFFNGESKPKPGTSTQYSVHGEGYMPTTSTIKSIPPGIYDISIDRNIAYAVPVAPPSGLLLELPEMRSEQVISTIDNFWNSEKDYKEGNEFVVGGAAFKAGIMIYGPPGSGKSCTIKLVCNKMIERGGTVFYASIHPNVVMEFLKKFSMIEKNRKCVVILEDIDSLIATVGEAPYLSMLDSGQSINNVLFIATTNYPELLDPRIYNRPGRFSHVIKIGYPTRPAREAYLKAILKNHRDVEYMVDNTAGFSIDHLTALVNAVYREKKELKNEIERLKALFNVPKSEEKTLGIGTGIEEK